MESSPSHQGWQRSSPNHSAMAGLQPSNSLFSIARLAVGCYFYDGKPFHLSQSNLCQTFSYRGRQCFQAGISMQANGQNGLQPGLLDFTGNPCDTMAMNRACSHHVKWSMDDHQGPPVDHGRERPAKRCLLEKVAGEETWNCTFYIIITCICVSYLHKSRCLTFCPSVYSSIQECVQYALPMSVYCILYMYTVPRRISAHLVQSGVIVNLHGICTSFHPSITLQYITHTTIQTEPYPQHK